MLGDTAVAVHPKDPRYTHLHGKFVIHPFNGRRIPIITDAITVDMEFGTGAVKITPAHDPNDFECGKRNNLEFISLMNDDGTYNENAGEYQVSHRRAFGRDHPAYASGYATIPRQKRDHQSSQSERALHRTKRQPDGDPRLLVSVCRYIASSAYSRRSGDVVEQILKPQWWVSCKPMAEEALKVRPSENPS